MKIEQWSCSEIHQSESRGTPADRVAPPVKSFAVRDTADGGAAQLSGVDGISRRMESSEGAHLGTVRYQPDLDGIEMSLEKNWALRKRLRVLGNDAAAGVLLVEIVHPYLYSVSYLSGLSSQLAVRRGAYAVIVDKVEPASGEGVSMEIGTRLPLITGAVGNALLCQHSHEGNTDPACKIESLKSACRDFEENTKVRAAILRGREEGAIGYIEENAYGLMTMAVPICSRKIGIQAAILAVGSKQQWRDGRVFSVWKFLTEISAALDCRM